MSDNNFKTKTYQKSEPLKTRTNAGTAYRYLNYDPVKYPDRPKEDCLEYNETFSGQEIIVFDRTPGYLWRYYKMTNTAHFNRVSVDTKDNFDEVIPENWRQKPRYDIDNFTKHAHKDIIMNTIFDYYIINHKLFPQIIECDSSGIDSETGAHKNSCHFIIRNCAFKNSADSKYASDQIIEILEAEDIIRAQDGDDKVRYCYDGGINCAKTHNLRAPLCTKNMRTKQIPAGYTREDCMVTGGLGTFDAKDDTIFVKTLEINNSAATKEPAIDLSVGQDIKAILNAAANWLTGWTFDCINGSFINFTRDRGTITDCKLCGREHTGDRTRSLLLGRAGIYLCCIKAKGKRELIIPAYALPNYGEVADKNIREKEAALLGQVDINSTPIIATKKPAARKPRDVAKIIAEHVENAPTEYQIAERYNFALHETYNEAIMREFPTTPRTLFVRANMKLGKTKKMLNYVANFKSVVIISARRTYTHELLSNINQGESHCFENYESLVGKIDLKEHPKIIIQVQSLHRLLCNTLPDLLVLDESESVINEFLAETMSPLNADLCMWNFHNLLEKAGHVIALDANLDHSTVDLIRDARGTADEFLVQNTYKNMSGDKIHIMFDEKALLDLIKAAIIAGQNIVVPTNSLIFSKLAESVLLELIPPDQILRISSEMNGGQKADIFSNVNDEWGKYRAVIFTPTCGAGISFERRHFDKVFAHFTTASTNVESWCQALYRARDISSGEYYVCINAKAAHNIPDIEAMMDVLKMKNRLSDLTVYPLRYRIVDHIDGTLTRDWIVDFAFKLVAHVKLVENQSKSRAVSHFINLCVIKGALIIPYTAKGGVSTGQRIREIKKDIKAADYDKIIEAREITPDELDNQPGIIDKSEYKAAFDKLALRETYDYAGKIDRKFLETYADINVMKVTENLRTALSHESIWNSIETVRLREVETKGKKSIRDDQYSRLKIAADLIFQAGFNHFCDPQLITGPVMNTNLGFLKKWIPEYSGLLALLFPRSSPIKIWSFVNCLRYVNSIIGTVFGCKIVKVSRNDDNYRIQNKIYGPLISPEYSDDRPYIIRGWKEPVKLPNDGRQIWGTGINRPLIT